MAVSEAYLNLEAAASLSSDFAVLRAEALSQVRSLSLLRDTTRTQLANQEENGDPRREAALAEAITRLGEQIAVWQGRATVYTHDLRAVARKRAAMPSP